MLWIYLPWDFPKQRDYCVMMSCFDDGLAHERTVLTQLVYRLILHRPNKKVIEVLLH
jgi:hypothetical protein